MRRFLVWLTLVLGSLPAVAAETLWRLDSVGSVGGHAVTVLGTPRVVDADRAKAMVFDGAGDGLLVPSIPFAGAGQFTIEILFRPDEGGLPEQRFLHAQDEKGGRALIETRLDGKGGWWLDTYLATGTPLTGLALIDPKRVHATGRWYWAALRYDGKTLAHFVNGEKEREGEVRFEPLGSGVVSLGVRQNKVYWFKGAIREVRFHSEAVPVESLQRVRLAN